MSLSIDTSTPAPGPYRLPTDEEKRTRIYFKIPFRDCTTVCEMNPDLEEANDATMRLFIASHDMHNLLNSLLVTHKGTKIGMEAERIINYIAGKNQ